MADTKISGLPASTTPLAGTEELPVVQSGVTRKVSVANLTTGRALSATQLTLTTGNLIVASGQGIDFSATPGTGTSELLADYEEGTWTPTVTPGGGSLTSFTSVGTYRKVGNIVSIYCAFTIVDAGTASSLATIGGFPFTSLNVAGVGAVATGIWREGAVTGNTGVATMRPNLTQGYVFGLTWTNTYRYEWSFEYQTA